MASVATTHDHDHPHGWRRWVLSTNHKDIGTMYLIFAMVGGIVGGALSVGIRLDSRSRACSTSAAPTCSTCSRPGTA